MRIRLDRTFAAAILVTTASAATAQTPAPQAATEPRPASAATPASPPEKKASAFDELWAVPTLYKNDGAGVLNELRVVGRLHLDNYVLDSDVSDDSDLVVRRARLGVRARLFDKLTAHVEGDFDLEGGPFYSRLTDAYLAWQFSDAARLTAGKQSVKFTLDGSTSSNELLTIDRSNVANNLWFTDEYIPGVSVSGKAGKWVYSTGIFSGGRENRTFGHFDAGVFWLGSLGYDLTSQLGLKKALLRADYVYNDPDRDSDFTRSFQNIGTLAFVMDDGRWGFSGELSAGDGSLGQSDVLGVTAMPWYSLTDRLQLVGRYTYVKSDEPNGVRFGRYESVVESGRGDRYNEAYAGLNYYLYGHKLKLQTGVTYADMRDRARDGGDYDGWTWTTALRLSW